VKSGISRPTIYLLILSLVLMISALLFSFLLLIPQGKEYRIERIEAKKLALSAAQYQRFEDETFEQLKELQSKHKHAISAFENRFDSERFLKLNKAYFEGLKIDEVKPAGEEEEFSLYEVNATSKIDSPESFYSFLESINKSDWIIAVDFPIHFEREGSLVRSNFKMRVYSLHAQE